MMTHPLMVQLAGLAYITFQYSHACPPRRYHAAVAWTARAAPHRPHEADARRPFSQGSSRGIPTAPIDRDARRNAFVPLHIF
jgi:hypothetical protein